MGLILTNNQGSLINTIEEKLDTAFETGLSTPTEGVITVPVSGILSYESNAIMGGGRGTGVANANRKSTKDPFKNALAAFLNTLNIQGAFPSAITDPAITRYTGTTSGLTVNNGVVTAGTGGSGGGSGSLWNLDAKPEVAHPWDLEFESNDFGPWTLDSQAVEGGVDTYANFSDGTVHYDLNNRRPSWLLLQASKGMTFRGSLSLQTALPTNLLMWAKVTSWGHNGSYSEGDRTVGIRMGDRSPPSGHNTGTEMYGYYCTGATYASQGYAWNGSDSVPTVNSRYVIGNTTVPTTVYIAVHKRGLTYHCWLASASGVWSHVLSYTYGASFTVPTLYLLSGNGITSGDPGNGIVGVDFIRFRETADFNL